MNKFEEIEKQYICIKDLQGGNFGVDRIQNIEEWKETAMFWAENDGNEELYNDLDNMKNDLVIDYIQELWELEIVEIDKKMSDILYNINEKINEIAYDYEKYFNLENIESMKICENKIKGLEYSKDIIYDSLRKGEYN